MGVQQFPGIELCFVWNRKKRGTEKKTQKIPVVSSNKYVFKPLPTNLFSGIAHSKTIHLNCSYDSMRLLPRKNHWPYVKIVFELFSCVLSLSSVLGGFIWIIFMCSIIIISIRKVSYICILIQAHWRQEQACMERKILLFSHILNILAVNISSKTWEKSPAL